MSLDTIKWMCKKLNTTYDASILTYLDEKSSTAMKVFVEKTLKLWTQNKIREVNSTLLILTSRYFFEKPFDLKYKYKNISGPMSLTFHASNKYDKRIYLFGEYHGLTSDCSDQKRKSSVQIQTFIKNLISSSRKFIDFYLEDESYRPVMFNASSAKNLIYIHKIVLRNP